MALHPHVRQGRYGESFVRVLAHSAGLSVPNSGLTAESDAEDDFSVDLRIGHAGPLDTLQDPMIGVQVKSWNRPDGNKEAWLYPLKSKYFNQLAGPAQLYMMPKFLVVVMVPADPASWSEATPEHLLLREAAYWVCLHDLPQRRDLAPETKVRVSVPRANLLTPTSMVEMVRLGERLHLEGRGVLAP